jgi:plastocyanin
MCSFRSVLVSALLIAATACGGSDSAPTSTPPPDGTSTPVSIPRGAESLANRAYQPDELEVAAGTTVTWTNTDSVSHTSTSNGAGWNGTLAPGARFSVVLPTPGTFPYHCSIHPGMVGTIVVR